MDAQKCILAIHGGLKPDEFERLWPDVEPFWNSAGLERPQTPTGGNVPFQLFANIALAKNSNTSIKPNIPLLLRENSLSLLIFFFKSPPYKFSRTRGSNHATIKSAISVASTDSAAVTITAP